MHAFQIKVANRKKKCTNDNTSTSLKVIEILVLNPKIIPPLYQGLQFQSYYLQII
jgi:hypothetical protein